MSLISTNLAEKNLTDFKIIDASWHLPSESRDPYLEYEQDHIPNSVFFDLDDTSEKDTDLPHMLPSEEKWSESISRLGISNNDKILIYDNSKLYSACRCWFSLLYFGHDIEKLYILNGGLKKWKQENKTTTNEKTNIARSNYKAQEKSSYVFKMRQINENVKSNNFVVVDARSLKRFNGDIDEPRKGLRKGNIKNSICLPYGECINQTTNEFKTNHELKLIFEKIMKIKNNNKFVFTCGSGVTASVLAYAYRIINNQYEPIIYDGSWSEYGKYSP
tara:strand:- start:2886 stop:3710 length:825 start_codon:yes stop_codon:yes gene_type:complete